MCVCVCVRVCEAKLDKTLSAAKLDRVDGVVCVCVQFVLTYQNVLCSCLCVLVSR